MGVLPLLLLALVGLSSAQVPPGPAEPEPVTVLEKYGPVIDRAEAAELGLFKYRQNFGALRFVRADSGRLEARVATTIRGEMLEQAVVLDSPAMARVWEGFMLLRDRGATNVELLLSPPNALDVSCLGPATHTRTTAGALCFGLLGIGAGSTVAMHTTIDYSNHGYVGSNWRKWGAPYAAVSAAGALAGCYLGWLYGSHADVGRPTQPRPRCAIAGYDNFGYPFYEEDVRQVLRPLRSDQATILGLVTGAIVASIVGPIIQSSFDSRAHYGYSSFVNQIPVYTMVLGTLATTGLVANTIGRNADRDAALARLRHRPRPQTP